MRILYSALLSLLVACCVPTTTTTDPLDDQDYGSSDVEELLDEELRMKELRIEMVKLQILSKVNLKEAPPSTEAPSEASRAMIKLLLKEEEEMYQRRRRLFDSDERLIIHAKNNGVQCLQSNEVYCKMYRFELSPTLNTSTLDVWIYKLTKFPRRISVDFSVNSSDEVKHYEALYYEELQAGWNKLQLPRIWLPPTWNDTVSYSLEIIGQNVEDRGEYRPFLMVTKTDFAPTRQRREAAPSCDTSETCCLKTLHVSVSEIGFNWVLYPNVLKINMCIGKCRMDHSSLRTHYERALTKVLEINSTVQASLGGCWTLCCKPKELEPLRVFYNDTDGIIHDQYIPELSVKSCSCS